MASDEPSVVAGAPPASGARRDAAGRYVPRPYRPPGLTPTPRVIYRTRRKDLRHLGRVERLRGEENLWIWRRFAEDFIRQGPHLPHDMRTWLFERGYAKDKLALYGLPREDSPDFLSDLQAEVMTFANGRDRTLLDNRQLFSQVFGDLLPLSPRLFLTSRGHLVPLAGPDALAEMSGRMLVLPVDAAEGDEAVVIDADRRLARSVQGGAAFEDLSGYILGLAGERIAVRAPEAVAGSVPGAVERLRLFVLRDPKDQVPRVLGAAHGFATESSAPFDTLAAGGISAGVDPATGAITHAVMLQDGRPVEIERHPDTDRPMVGRFVPGWWSVVAEIQRALRLMPVFAAVQFDVVQAGGGRFHVLDAKARCEAAEFQVHAPLLASQRARRFIREYGL